MRLIRRRLNGQITPGDSSFRDCFVQLLSREKLSSKCLSSSSSFILLRDGREKLPRKYVSDYRDNEEEFG